MTELPGILAWAVRGCLEWQRTGLGVAEEVREATEGYRTEMDVLAAFLDECCTVAPTASTSARELYAAYRAWCEEGGERWASHKAFGLRLKERGFTSERVGRGYAVEEIEPPRIAEAARAWLDLLAADLHGLLWPMISPLVSPGARQFMGTFLEQHPDPERAAVSQAFIARSAILRAWAEFQQSYPLIVAPICTEPPFAVGADLDGDGIERILVAMRMVVAINLLGLPAAAVPVGTDSGLPQVVQVIGQRFREDACLEAAAAIEGRLGRLTPIDPA
jgi:hypothetical protein